ncbi:MAG: hypothetical protein J6X49_18835, partial [Victivallales bacterium]|nr:hypothetical protein [Victivallales bacterium]
MYCTMRPSHATRRYRIPTGPPSDAACAPGEFGVRWKSAACGFTKFAFTKTGLSMSEYRQVPFYSEAQMELEALGTVEGARNQMADDMIRPANYAKNSAPGQNLINEDDAAGFGVRFPDGEQFTANGTPQGRENINRIAEKIKNLCGDVHPRQTSSVMAMLSQAGMGVLVTNLASHGIKGNEHCVMDFSLSKNNETGDVFIRYSSPKGLKFAFKWTATVKIDGTVTTSPFQFTDEDTLKAKTDAAFEAFVNRAEAWRKLLANYRPAAAVA